MSIVVIQIEDTVGAFTSNGESEATFYISNFSEEDPHVRGRLHERTFFDEWGQEGAGLEVRHRMEFNTDIEHQRKNLDLLKSFLKSNPELAQRIKIHDPEEAERTIYETSKKQFEVESFLRENEQNHLLLGKIYRRVMDGFVSGKRPTQIFNELVTQAKKDPNRFYKNDQLIFNDREFETMALIDAAIEKGILRKDREGHITRNDGHVFAENIEKATYVLKNNDDLRLNLRLQVEDELTETNYAPIIVDTGKLDIIEAKEEDIVVAAKEEGSKVDEESIAANIERMVKAKLLTIKGGKGPGAKYSFYDATPSAKPKSKAAVISHLKKNPARYKSLLEVLEKAGL